MTIAIPSNSLLFYQFIASVSNFQVIDTRSVLGTLIDFDLFNDQPFNNYFDALEYESTNFVLVLDLMFFVMLANVILMLASLFLSLVNFKACLKFTRYLEEKIFFSFILRTLIESYLLLCLASSTALYSVITFFIYIYSSKLTEQVR